MLSVVGPIAGLHSLPPEVRGFAALAILAMLVWMLWPRRQR